MINLEFTEGVKKLKTKQQKNYYRIVLASQNKLLQEKKRS